MPAQPLSDDLALEAAEAFKKFNNKAQAARSLDLPSRTYDHRLKVAAQRGFLGTEPVLPAYVIKKTSTQLGPDGELQREWVQQTPEPGEVYELLPGHIIKGESALIDADGRVVQKWVKTRTDTSVPDLVASLEDVFIKYQGFAPLVPTPANTDEDLLSVYPIADQHNGLHAWGQQTGEDYDLKIGADRLRSCMSRLITQSPPSKQALILNLGDWQHTDDAKNMTPRSGNILDVDSRYAKILTCGVQLMMDCIEMALQKHEQVIVRNLPGNHDPHASIALTVALAAFYSKNPRVTIDDDPGDFFFHRFGQTLIGATHGHKMKPDRMAMTMAVRCRKDWGETAYHWFLFGHIHHETLKEVGDVRCESFQTLAAKDNHAASSGYNSGQSLNSITLHRHDGEIGRHRINLPPPAAYMMSRAA
jgi:hypothetical protein